MPLGPGDTCISNFQLDDIKKLEKRNSMPNGIHVKLSAVFYSDCILQIKAMHSVHLCSERDHDDDKNQCAVSHSLQLLLFDLSNLMIKTKEGLEEASLVN